MIRFFKILTVFFLCVAASWIVFINLLPVLFIRQMENKYGIVLKGERAIVFVEPLYRIKNASFTWQDKVELVQGDFEITLNPWRWAGEKVWAMSLQGDGSKLRFLGDWLKKTGVREVQTTRLRLVLDFYDGDIREIHEVDVVAPDYQFQIQRRSKAA